MNSYGYTGTDLNRLFQSPPLLMEQIEKRGPKQFAVLIDCFDLCPHLLRIPHFIRTFPIWLSQKGLFTARFQFHIHIIGPLPHLQDHTNIHEFLLFHASLEVIGMDCVHSSFSPVSFSQPIFMKDLQWRKKKDFSTVFLSFE